MTTTLTAPLVIDQPGIYDIPNDVYHADPVPGGSLSSSSARRLLAVTPARWRYEQDNQIRENKPEYDFGHVAHKLVLGVGEQVERVAAKDWRTNAAKDQRAAAYDAGRVPILDADYTKAERLAEAVAHHPLASALFSNGQPEQSAFWVDERTSIWRRARFDWLRDPIVDLKTCDSADPWHIERAVYQHGYHGQAAYYRDAVRALDLHPDPAFLFVFVEKAPPHLVHVVQLDALALAKGDDLNRRAIDTYVDCTRTGQWPGYGNDITTISLPAYALREDF